MFEKKDNLLDTNNLSNLGAEEAAPNKRNLFQSFFLKRREKINANALKYNQAPQVTLPKKSNVSRREFLKRIGISAVGAAIGAKFYDDHQPVLNKIGRSVREGRIVDDIREMVESQFAKDEQLTLAEPDEYRSDWLVNIFENMQFFKVNEKEHARIAFLEITNRCTILQTESPGQDISTAFDHTPSEFITIPYPQHNELNEYLMHAVFNVEGTIIDGSPNTPSHIRGGLVFQQGKTRVGMPGDFPSDAPFRPYESFSDAEPNSAQIEYFFVLDSKTLARDLEALGSIHSDIGKNFRNTSEFSSAIVTFYSEQHQSFRTFVMSSYRDTDITNERFSPLYVDDFTIPQLTSLATDFIRTNLQGFDRFIIAFGDPGPNQYLAHSEALSNDDLIENELTPFRTRALPIEQMDSAMYHRVLGGNASDSSTYRPVLANKLAYLVAAAL